MKKAFSTFVAVQRYKNFRIQPKKTPTFTSQCLLTITMKNLFSKKSNFSKIKTPSPVTGKGEFSKIKIYVYTKSNRFFNCKGTTILSYTQGKYTKKLATFHNGASR